MTTVALSGERLFAALEKKISDGSQNKRSGIWDVLLTREEVACFSFSPDPVTSALLLSKFINS